jgi:hypothetical protein
VDKAAIDLAASVHMHCFLLERAITAHRTGTDIPLPQGLHALRAGQMASIASVDVITGDIPANHALWLTEGALHGTDTARGAGEVDTLQLRRVMYLFCF